MRLSERITYILLISMLAFFPGCSEKPALVITDSSAGKSSAMTVGEIAEVRLSAQLGTGYSWKWTDSGGFFEQAGSEKTVTSGEAKTGGRDTQVFLFRAVKPGEARLDFFYNQSWEASASPLKRFSVPVLIKPMGKN